MRWASLLALAALASPAEAQECHPVVPTVAVPMVRAAVAVEVAAIDDGLGRTGSYEGIIPSLELALFGTRVRAALGAYHAVWGQRGDGLGDLQLALQRPFAAAGATRFGATLSATLPTGDRMTELGMGHPMIMPGVWARWSGLRSSLLGSVVYGSMLGGGHHHTMPEPITSPMNPQEVAAALRGGRMLGATELAATLSGAAPLGTGVWRGAVGTSARHPLAGWDLGLELSVPFAGSPIDARAAVELSRAF